MSADKLIEELRAGLDGVTPGPWRLLVPDRGYCSNYVLTDAPEFAPIAGKHPWRHLIADFDDCAKGEINASHIARCSPENIRTLLEALASLQADNLRLREALDEALRLVDVQIAGHRLSAKDATQNLMRASKAEAELEMWRDVKHSSHWKERAEAAEAEILRLKAALAPFAKAGFDKLAPVEAIHHARTFFADGELIDSGPFELRP